MRVHLQDRKRKTVNGERNFSRHYDVIGLKKLLQTSVNPLMRDLFFSTILWQRNGGSISIRIFKSKNKKLRILIEPSSFKIEFYMELYALCALGIKYIPLLKRALMTFYVNTLTRNSIFNTLLLPLLLKKKK